MNYITELDNLYNKAMKNVSSDIMKNWLIEKILDDSFNKKSQDRINTIQLIKRYVDSLKTTRYFEI